MEPYIILTGILYLFGALWIAKDLATKKYPYSKETEASTDVVALIITLIISGWALYLITK
jgi:hypothetical protein